MDGRKKDGNVVYQTSDFFSSPSDVSFARHSFPLAPLVTRCPSLLICSTRHALPIAPHLLHSSRAAHPLPLAPHPLHSSRALPLARCPPALSSRRSSPCRHRGEAPEQRKLGAPTPLVLPSPLLLSRHPCPHIQRCRPRRRLWRPPTTGEKLDDGGFSDEVGGSLMDLSRPLPPPPDPSSAPPPLLLLPLNLKDVAVAKGSNELFWCELSPCCNDFLRLLH
jgi:hypothetical protein